MGGCFLAKDTPRPGSSLGKKQKFGARLISGKFLPEIRESKEEQVRSFSPQMTGILRDWRLTV